LQKAAEEQQIEILSSFSTSHKAQRTKFKRSLLAERLKIGDEVLRRKAESLCIETSKMLGAFIQSLKG